jgi:hypothetical protein
MYTRFDTRRPLTLSFCSNVAGGCLTHIASTQVASWALTAKAAAGRGITLKLT